MSDHSNHSKKYRAAIGERTIDLEFGDDDVGVNGERRTLSSVPLAGGGLSLIVDGRSYSADVAPGEDGRYVVYIGGSEFEVVIRSERDLLLERFGLDDASSDGHHQIRAPMPGLVLSLHVEAGAAVEAGDAVVVLEAMKMENELRAPGAGIVKSVLVEKGDAVGKNDLLVEIET